MKLFASAVLLLSFGFAMVNAAFAQAAVPTGLEAGIKLGEMGASIEKDLQNLNDQLQNAEEQVKLLAQNHDKDGDLARREWAPRVTNLRRARSTLQQAISKIERGEDPFPPEPLIVMTTTDEILQREFAVDGDDWVSQYRKQEFEFHFAPASIDGTQDQHLSYDSSSAGRRSAIVKPSFKVPPSVWVSGLYDSGILDTIKQQQDRIGKDVLIVRVTPISRPLYFPRIQLTDGNSIGTIPGQAGNRKVSPQYRQWKEATLSKGTESGADGGNVVQLIRWDVQSVRWKPASNPNGNTAGVRVSTTAPVGGDKVSVATDAAKHASAPDPELFFGIAQGFENEGQSQSAVRRYKTLIQRFPGTPAAERAKVRLSELDQQNKSR